MIKNKMLIVAAAPLLLCACATLSDQDRAVLDRASKDAAGAEQRDYLDAAVSELNAANRAAVEARQAEDKADKAAADAKAASDKADRIFQHSLRK